MIKLTVKTLDAQNHEFSVEDESTVGDLKTLITERVGLAPDVQRLIFHGRVLNDATKLSELDVNGKVVHLVEREPPRAGQRPTAPEQRDGQQRAGTRPLFGGLGGPFTQQQMENVILEAIGLDGPLGMAFRRMSGDDATPRIGHTLLRLGVVRRMLDLITSNVLALDETADSLPNLSDPPSNPRNSAGTFRNLRTLYNRSDPPSNPRNSGSTFRNLRTLYCCNSAPEMSDAEVSPEPRSTPGDTASPVHMDQSSTDEDGLGMTERELEEWLDATDDTSQAPGGVSNAGTQATVETSSVSTNTSVGAQDVRPQQRNPVPPTWMAGQETEDRTRRASEQMAAAIRDLSAVQQQLSRHLDMFADALVETHNVGSERTNARQRMMRRVTETLHGLSHVYHVLSDVEVSLGAPQARCLSLPAMRRFQLPVQTQINVLSNRRQGPASAAPSGPMESGSGSAFTVSSGGSDTSTPDLQQQSARQPTVHVDIRPEPLSYQVEIETSLPIAFAINRDQQESNRSNSSNNNNDGGPTNRANANGNAANSAERRTNDGGPAMPTQAQQQQLNEMMEQGGDFIMGVSVPWGVINQGQPQFIAAPFPFGNGSTADIITSVVQSALNQEFANAASNSNANAASVNNGSAANGAASANNAAMASDGNGGANAANNGAAEPRMYPSRNRQRRQARVRHQMHGMFGSHRQSVFNRFLPCRYEQTRRSRNRPRTDERTSEDIVAAMRPRNLIPHVEPSVPDLVGALRGYAVTDFLDMEHHMPGENWLIDMLMIASRSMTAAELVVAWSGVTPAISALHAPLRQFMRNTIVRERPATTSQALLVYTTIADSIEQQNRDVREWIESSVAMSPRVDLESSLRNLLRARVPQILQVVSEDDNPNFAARFVALVSRAFVDACAIVQYAGRDRNIMLNALFRIYITDFLQHMEPSVVRRLVDLIEPFVTRLSDELSSPSYVASIKHYVAARAHGSGPAAGAPAAARSEPAMDTSESRAGEPRIHMQRGGIFNIDDALRAARPRTAGTGSAGAGAGASPPRAAAPPAQPAEPQWRSDARWQPPPPPPSQAPLIVDASPPPNIPSEWTQAMRRDAARQRIAGAERTRFSDAYLSGAPPRKRKLLTQDKPDLANMLQECIREAARSRPPLADMSALLEDAGVQRAYGQHIRALARARIGSSEDWSRERYPASYHYFAAPNKRPFPDDSTE